MKRISFLIALIILAIAPASTARGKTMRLDVASPPPPAGANIFPGADITQVRMMAETVEINAAQNEPGEKPISRIRATSKMRNMGTEEENLPVRFPLNFLFPDYQSDWEQCEYPLAYPEISDFSALVEGQPAEVTTIQKKIAGPVGNKGTVDVACWANFPVAFPPGKDINIEVRYTTQGYPGVYGTNVYVQFNYVLTSGAGWKGTIGSADIIFHAPFELNKKVQLPYFPETGVLNGSEIRWHFSDFEPDSNINVAMMDPGHWQLIQEETRQVTENPQDGKAWERLAQAYKEAVLLQPAGWRTDQAGYEMFAQSATDYAKAISLLPDDPDLRTAYAELLVWDAFYPAFGRPEDIPAGLVRGVEQLKRALDINPRNARAYALLQKLAAWPAAPRPIVDLRGPKPVYLILTPGVATYTPIPTRTRTPFPPSLTPSPTWTRNPTRTPTITSTATQTFTPFPTVVEQAAATPIPSRAGSSGVCGAVLLPVIMTVLVFLIKRNAMEH